MLHVHFLAFKLKHVKEVFLTSVSKLLLGIENSDICSFFNFKTSGPSHHNLFSIKFLVIPTRVIKSAGLYSVGQLRPIFNICIVANFSKTVFYKCFKLLVIAFIQIKVTFESVHK